LAASRLTSRSTSGANRFGIHALLNELDHVGQLTELLRGPLEPALAFAHSLVPIAFAYSVAHYFSLLVLEGQGIISLISDPFGFGWDLFGTADRDV